MLGCYSHEQVKRSKELVLLMSLVQYVAVLEESLCYSLHQGSKQNIQEHIETLSVKKELRHWFSH